MKPVISIHNVSVSFKKGTIENRTLKHAAANLFRQKKDTYFTALDNVSLSINEGGTIGIIGRNGSGKTTLLRVIANIIIPGKGSVHVGRIVTPLLALGIGFHPELSGRENCYLAGALLGFIPKRIKEKMEKIIGFSELGDFIDVPVKHYSSGMFARLAFALATEVEPEILLLDEILGVGDEFFQRKCIHRMQGLIKKGITTLIVSHNLDYLVTQCKRIIWIDEGRIAADGEPAKVVKAYRANMGQSGSAREKKVPLSH